MPFTKSKECPEDINDLPVEMVKEGEYQRVEKLVL